MAADPVDLVALFEVDDLGALPDASYNIAPTDRVPIVVEPRARVNGTPRRRLESASWGLVPAWAKDTSRAASAINARSETVADRKTFADALVARRAIVPAEGWYEWRKPGRIPYYVHGDEPLALAGLYAWWRAPEGQWRLSTTILTTAATGDLAELHERMPLVLAQELWNPWLDASVDGDEALVAAAVEHAAAEVATLELHAVDRAVGNVRAEGRHLIAPVA